MTPTDRLRVTIRLCLVVLVALGFAAGCYVIATTRPTRDSIYPKCPTFTAFGLHCPGCGTGRAAHLLLNGQPLLALRCNAFAPFFLPFLVYLAFHWLIRWSLQLPAPRRRLVPAFWLWLLAAALILYTVLRNIPAEPFNYLAPREFSSISDPTTPR